MREHYGQRDGKTVDKVCSFWQPPFIFWQMEIRTSGSENMSVGEGKLLNSDPIIDNNGDNY